MQKCELSSKFTSLKRVLSNSSCETADRAQRGGDGAHGVPCFHPPAVLQASRLTFCTCANVGLNMIRSFELCAARVFHRLTLWELVKLCTDPASP